MRARELTFRQLFEFPLFRVAIFLAVFVLLTLAISQLWQIFLPVFIGLILGYITNPLIQKCDQRWGVDRRLSAALFLMGAVSILGLTAYLAFPIVLDQLSALFSRVPEYIEFVEKKTSLDLGAFKKENLTDNKWFNAKDLVNGSGQVLTVVTTFLSQTTYILFALLMIPIFWFSFAVFLGPIKDWLDHFIPMSKKKEVHSLLKKMDKAVFGFFRGRLIVASIMGVMFSIGWWWAGVPFWFVLGMITGYLSIVPYMAALGWPVAVLLTYAEINHSGEASFAFMDVLFWPSFVYGVVQFIEGWFLTPYIQGEKTDLSVSAVLIVVFIGGSVGGILGMLLAIPLASCLKLFLNECVFPELRAWAANN